MTCPMRFEGKDRDMDAREYARAGTRSARFYGSVKNRPSRTSILSEFSRVPCHPSPMNRLSGKRAVVTGAASGIGRASAELFASEGATVVVCDTNEEGLGETAAHIEAAGGRARTVVADVSDGDA